MQGREKPARGSLSSWRAWIEIWSLPAISVASISRSPHGERGLKSHDVDHGAPELSRSPHGERGLKSNLRFRGDDLIRQSLSSWRAWIEIPMISPKSAFTWSLSSWRAWIEISAIAGKWEPAPQVALLMESVD